MKHYIENVSRVYKLAGQQHLRLLNKVRLGKEGCETEEKGRCHECPQGYAIEEIHGWSILQMSFG